MSKEISIISITSKDPTMFDSFDDLIMEILSCLSNLKVLALKTNFTVLNERQKYFDNVVFLKRFYECIDDLVYVETSFKMSTKNKITPKQMVDWIQKLEVNLQKFFVDGMSPEELFVYFQHQYALLNVIIKVLNGDAYFVGCLNPHHH